jgi:WD40 repeat protein
MMVSLVLIAQETDPIKTLKFRNLETSGDIVTNFALSPNGKYLGTYHQDFTIEIDENRTSKTIWKYESNDQGDKAYKFVFISDNQIAIQEGKSQISLFDLETGKVNRVIKLDSYCSFFAFSNNGQYLMISSGKSVKIYDSKSMECLADKSLAMNHGYVNFSKDDKHIIIADNYGTGIYKTKSFISEKYPATIRRDRASYKEAYVRNEKSIYIFPDDSKMLILHSKILSLFKYFGDKPIKEFGTETKDILPNGLAVSADGKWAATAHEDNTIKIWDIKTGKLIRTENSYEPAIGLAFSPNGKELIYLIKRAQ